MPKSSKIRAFFYAFLGTFVLHTILAWYVDRYPLGSKTNAVGDFSWQFQAFYANVLNWWNGEGTTSLTFSWLGGAGYPAIGDYATYAGGPFPWLLLLFGQNHVELGLFVIILLKLSLAAGLASILFSYLLPNLPAELAAFFGIAYATSGWVLDDGIHRIMWLDGFYGLPLLCLIAWNAYTRRTFALGILGIALIWWSNYYSAFISSVGSAIFLFFALLASDKSSEIPRRIALFAMQGVLGVLMTSIFLYPTFIGVKEGVEQTGRNWEALNLNQVALRFLPGTGDTFITPALFVGTVSLLFVAYFIFSLKRDDLRRLFWLGPVAVMALSFSSQSLMTLWNLGDSPNGSWFRSTYVLTFFLILVAAQGAHGWWVRLPQLRASAMPFIGVGIFLGTLEYLATYWTAFLHISEWTYKVPWMVLAALIILTLVLAIPVIRRNSILISSFVALSLIAPQAIEMMWMGKIARTRQLNYLAHHVVRDNEAPQILSLIRKYRQIPDAWPQYRFANRKPGLPYNDGIFFGYPATSLYSSIVNPVLGQTMFKDLGLSGSGRMISTFFQPDLEFIMAEKYQLKQFRDGWKLTTNSASPLVRLIDTEQINGVKPVSNSTQVFRNRAALIGVQNLYQPVIGISKDSVNMAENLVPNDLKGVFYVMCPTHTKPSYDQNLVRGYSNIPAQKVGDQLWRIYYSGHLVRALTPNDFRCYNPQKLVAAEKSLQVNAATKIKLEGAHLEATLPSIPLSDAKQILVATPSYPGWQCELDGRPAKTGSSAGLLTVLGTGKNLLCNYKTPGLMVGAVMTSASFIIWLGLFIMLNLKPEISTAVRKRKSA
ncbi:hypothetical protein BSR29_00805 [Boudabousia liubingyangii]|uniref:YfhO family protein n=1 Tax=Boudabousia liubingyangii TaxID=1921764 RepID=A0A1Q5PPT5_9ACTO|nr:YfhO family protein [Boudabousia liubingyangii]OKL49529.1 hypothetical protein BSR29_00805 [Boudabousia liubingyangii]